MQKYIDITDADVIASLDDECERLEQYDNDSRSLVDTVESVRSTLNLKLMLAQKYGFDEYADELAILLEKLDTFRKMK